MDGIDVSRGGDGGSIVSYPVICTGLATVLP